MRNWLNGMVRLPAAQVARRYIEIALAIAFISFIAGVFRSFGASAGRFDGVQTGPIDWSWLVWLLPMVAPIIATAWIVIATVLTLILAGLVTVRVANWIVAVLVRRGLI